MNLMIVEILDRVRREVVRVVALGTSQVYSAQFNSNHVMSCQVVIKPKEMDLGQLRSGLSGASEEKKSARRFV